MGASTLTRDEFRKRCAQWGFEVDGDAVVNPDTGDRITVNGDMAAAVSTAAHSMGMPREKFVAGPPRKKQGHKSAGAINTKQRRKMMQLLHMHGGHVGQQGGDEADGRWITNWLADQLGTSPQAVNQLVAGMIRDRQIRVDGRGRQKAKRRYDVELLYDGPLVKEVLGVSAPPKLPAPVASLGPWLMPPFALFAMEAPRIELSAAEAADALLRRVSEILVDGDLPTIRARHAKETDELKIRLLQETEYVAGLRRRVARLETDLVDARHTIESLTREKLVRDNDLEQLLKRNGKAPLPEPVVQLLTKQLKL